MATLVQIRLPGNVRFKASEARALAADNVVRVTRTRAMGAAAEIAKHAAAIDKSSAGGAQKTTDANVKKMAAAIDALRTELKAK